MTEVYISGLVIKVSISKWSYTFFEPTQPSKPTQAYEVINFTHMINSLRSGDL